MPHLLRSCREIDFFITKRQIGDFDWLFRKGIFPYTWLDDWSKLDVTALPPIDAFFDTLTNCINISESEYHHAQSVWLESLCHTFQDYLQLYLKADVCQLADVFENFRTQCIQQDGLEAVNYFTIPQLTWDSAFKYTQCQVELLTDVEMYEFFEGGIRGGMSFVNKHYAISNSPAMHDPVTHNIDPHEILYVDENNLYGAALSMRLPQWGFMWMTPEEMAALDWLAVDTEGDEGYTLEVDLEYPESIHDKSIDLPYAPERLTPRHEWLTQTQLQQYKNAYIDRHTYKGTSKLMLTQFNKEKYVVHFKILKFYLQQGMRISKFHRGVKYVQAAFLEPYVTYNSIARQNTNDKLLQDFYKLKNNSLYGKTMENLRNRTNFKIVNDEVQHQRLCSRDTFIDSIYFTPELVGVRTTKMEVKLNKPVYIGQCVLDNSKLIMYQLKYERLTSYEDRFNASIDILAGDTDSFFLSCYGVTLSQLLPAMQQDGLLDTSNYHPSHPLFSNTKKAVLGCVKDEACGVPIREMVFLRPKCYSLLLDGDIEKKRAKGVQSCVVRNNIKHAQYKAVYEENVTLHCNTRRIGSERHQLFTFETTKLALSCFDDKRAWVSENVSYPFGHYSLPKVTRAAPPVAPLCPNVAPDTGDIGQIFDDLEAQGLVPDWSLSVFNQPSGSSQSTTTSTTTC